MTRLRQLVRSLLLSTTRAVAIAARHAAENIDAVEAVAGVILLAIGAAKIYAPLGYVVPGAALLTFAVWPKGGD